MMLLVTAIPRCSVTSPNAETIDTGSGSGNCEPARIVASPSPNSRSYTPTTSAMKRLSMRPRSSVRTTSTYGWSFEYPCCTDPSSVRQ
ncbi:hypothetical protein P9139_08290 [Curtobacterium flaccumfaciens]|nr:hypothetical protein P9139_08290 [Curtobacterium flaccumfaciens]